MSNSLLESMLPFAVFMRVADLKKRGGPTVGDYELARAAIPGITERGDVLMFGGGKKGEVADLFNSLAHSVAVLAFQPGGVDLFGHHYEERL